LSAGDQGQMSLWHSDREKVAQLSESNNGIGCEISQCISLSDGSFLSAGVVTRWSKGGVKERVLGPIYGDVELFFNSIAIFENGHVLSVIDSEKWVIWDSATESIVKEVEAPIKLAIHSDIHILDGYRLTVHQNEYTQIMVDCYKGEILGKYSGHLNMVNSVGRLSNGKYFSTAWDNTIHIWSFEDTKDATILKGHTDAVMSALELSDNRLLSVSNDGSAKIWDLNAECILLTVTPSEHDFKLSGLGQCAVLSGGMYALASLDRVVYLYDSEWTKVGMMRVRSDIGLLKAVDRNQLLIGQKDGSLLMVDVFPSG
jgi:WD40 repeat protein